MSKVENNVELLKAMNVVVSYLNNDEAIIPWYMGGVPDGADEDDFNEMASDDETMDFVCGCFGRVMRAAWKDGWFTAYDGEPVAYGVVNG